MPKCKHPLYIHDAGGAVGCGQCTPCRISARREKTARLLSEAVNCPDILFVHLTYKDEYLPLRGPCCHLRTGEVLPPKPTLRRSDLVKFNKRLRRRLAPRKIRIAYCGEYGEKKGRPHFHLIIFGATLKDSAKIFESWIHPRTRELMCDPARLSIEVPRNDLHVSQYVMGYILKKMTNPLDDRLDLCSPEFARLPDNCGHKFIDQFIDKLPNMWEYIQKNHDLPRSFRYAGKDWPIPYQFRKKILERMPLYGPEIKNLSKAAYQEKMRPLFEAARSRASIPEGRPFEKWTHYEIREFRHHFAELAALENAPSVAVIERRFELNQKPRKN